jgi:PAS domain S-box-containing protein
MLIPEADVSRRQPPLSQKEEQVLHLAAQGLTDKEIAVKTKVKFTTVRTYWDRIRKKLNAANRAHAIALGMPHNRLELAGEELSAFIVRQIDHEAIFVCGEEGTLLTWNKGVEILFGYTELEWIGKNADILFIPGEKQDAPVEFEEADRAGSSVNYRWHQRKDGGRFWAANIVIPFEPPHNPGAYAKIVRPKPAPEED